MVVGEKDPLGKDPHEPGSKLDAGKTEFYNHLFTYFPEALRAVEAISAYGARKYTRMGWATVPDGVRRYTEALLRHVMAEARGEQVDPESGLDHDAQVAWNALARLELRLRSQPCNNNGSGASGSKVAFTPEGHPIVSSASGRSAGITSTY